jgi:hypothetical protein
MLQRRTFLCWLVSSAALPLRGLRLHAQAARFPIESVATLRVVATVVLPSELTAAGHEKVVNDFVQWLSSYRSGAERNWGYGSPRKTGTAAIDTNRYARQLRELEDRARKRAPSLAGASPDVRIAVVVEALEQSGVRDLPASPDGRHVIADVMSFFFQRSAALDLAYRARIRRATCRGLAGGEARPVAGD